MSRFTFGLICGVVSAAVTWCFTDDVQLVALAGAIEAVAVWLFVAVLDD